MPTQANNRPARRTAGIRFKALASDKSKGAAEKRSSVRANMITAAAVSKRRQSPDKVWVTNISLGGIGFQSARHYARGSGGFIRLDAGPIRFANRCKVIWCRRRAKRAYDVGCELLAD